ncbi:MAG: tRNA-dihydrouridine synthase, partial [Holosporales bacterium]|nr:tRNA-dihydrouridine synthase [Holosporales bacterium]
SSIARIAEDLGIQMITVHGRTRSQLYSGPVNWLEVNNVKQIVNIPVIVNGDIIDISSAKQALTESGADGIMIGRGACGSPWILQDIHNYIEAYMQMPNRDKLKIAKKHFEYIFEFYGNETAKKLSRRILMSYIKGKPNASKYRYKTNQIETYNNMIEILQQIFFWAILYFEFCSTA